MRGRKRSLYGVSALAVAALAALAVAGNAAAAPWCGTVSAGDRPQVVGGPTIRVIYAIASDGGEQSMQRAPQISADVETITEWWRSQDYARVPRFDVATFPCGRQADIVLARLPQSAGDLSATDTRFTRIVDAVDNVGPDPPYSKYLVYYDGPVADSHLCGEGGGSAVGPGVAVVYLAACQGVSSAVVAAHELVHAFGALPDTGPAHPCPGDSGHPCDSTGDLLYPYASSAQLAVLALDVGHDDYYAHSGSWLDLQDSAWLRHIEAPPAMLTVNPTGGGSVRSDVPGIDCDAACSVEFDAGSQVALAPSPDPGRRFVRWSGGCVGANGCTVMLAQAANVGALFAPARYRLTVAVSGKGKVTSVAASIVCPGHCAASAESYTPVALRAVPARGWKLRRWTGCPVAKTGLTCRVPMTGNAGVRALFVRR